MAQPTNRRNTRHVSRADSIVADTPAATPDRDHPERQELFTDRVHIPQHYFLVPTSPSPFKGTLDASLEALLQFGRLYPNAMGIMDVLRKDVDTKTNWRELLTATLQLEEEEVLPSGRLLLEELLFLVTRKLLPEQIAQNRAVMFRMYETKRSVSMRMALRYDMVREWSKRNNNHFTVVESRPLPLIPSPYVWPPNYSKLHPGREPLMPNVWATLIAGPLEGYGAIKMREAMKHHVTGLDRLLMLTDEQVAEWGANQLFQMTTQVVLQWQWLRKNTEIMGDMEVKDWEDLNGPANECDWVREQR